MRKDLSRNLTTFFMLIVFLPIRNNLSFAESTNERPAIKDSFLWQILPDTNEGANSRLRLQVNNRLVIAYDLSGIDLSKIKSAKMVLTLAERTSLWSKKQGVEVDAHPLRVVFQEGNGKNLSIPISRGTGPGVTWHCATDTNIANIKPDCNPRWEGGNFSPATAPPVVHANNMLTGNTVEWNVTADVRAGVTAWLVKKRKQSIGSAVYYSKEGALAKGNSRLAPKLVIETEAANPVVFSLPGNMGDSLLLRAERVDGYIIEYFGERDANGTPTKFDAIFVTHPNGGVTKVSLDDESRPIQIFTPEGVTLKLNWQSATRLVLIILSADGTEQEHIPVDIPPASQARLSALAKVNASILQSLASASDTSTVTVTQCSLPVDDASVSMVIDLSFPAGSITRPGIRTGSGEYTVSIPRPESIPTDILMQSCPTLQDMLSAFCSVSDIAPVLEGACIAGSRNPGACTRWVAGLSIACAGPGPGAPSISELLDCSAIDESLLEPFVDVFLDPTIDIPGQPSASIPGKSAPAFGPYPDFTYEVEVEQSVITSFSTSPEDPSPNQGYLATGSLCTPSDTTVLLSIEGTDGYTDSTTCTANPFVESICPLFVPGAEGGVEDTLTITTSDGVERQISIIF